MISYKEKDGPYSIKKMIKGREVPFSDEHKREMALQRWDIAIKGAINADRPMPILEKIDPNKTALIVVDMQKAFLDKRASIEVPGGRDIVDNINKIAKAIRENGGTVVFFRYLVNENMGLLRNFEKKSYLSKNRESPLKALTKEHREFQLHPDLNVEKDDLILDKIRYSAVHGSEIVKILREKKIENVIVTGVTTDVCAGNTAECLMQSDFNVIMCWDGTAALDRLEHEIYLARIFGLYGDIMPADEIIRRISIK